MSGWLLVAQCDGGHRFTPPSSLNFDFWHPVNWVIFLICESEVTRHTNRTGFVSGRLVGPDGPVITGSGIFKITDIKIETVSGKSALPFWAFIA